MFKKASLKGSRENAEKYINSSVLLSVSIGQKAHEGREFIGTLESVNDSFKSVTVLLGDSLQRHTLSLLNPSLSKNELHKLAISNGDAWLLRNQKYLELLDIPWDVKRWDYWLNLKNFKEKRELIEREVNTNSQFAMCLEESINQFLNRFHSRTGRLATQKEADLCREFVKEECAIIILCGEHGYSYDIYPTARNPMMNRTCDLFVDKNLLQHISINFRSISLKPKILKKLEPESII